MIQSKKAIGFFGSLAFLAFGYFYFSAKGVLPFADFALLEWQTKLVEQGIFYLPYTHQTQDPNFSFFPLPDLFFQLTNGTAQSTFPNFYPLLISPIFRVGELSGVVISQIILFFGAICIFHQIRKDAKSTLLLLFGSTLPIYVFLIHETVLIFSLEILVLFLFHKERPTIAGLISAVIIWIRPEMGLAMVFIPFCFTMSLQLIRFEISVLFGLVLLSLGNFFITDSLLPLRMAKNSDFQFRPENAYYLIKIWAEQVPVFLVSIFFLLHSFFNKKTSISLLFLFLITMIMILLAPNTGGHNTPRYLYGLVPLYILILSKGEEPKTLISYQWIFLITLVSLYTVWNLNTQIKELKKISKFQSNTLSEISKLGDSVLLFNNSDFSFVVLPLLYENKDLLLLRKDYNPQLLTELLQKENIKSFTFLELPPSPYSLPDNLILSNCPDNCSFRKTKTLPLPNALLPITQTQYLRK